MVKGLQFWCRVVVSPVWLYQLWFLLWGIAVYLYGGINIEDVQLFQPNIAQGY